MERRVCSEVILQHIKSYFIVQKLHFALCDICSFNVEVSHRQRTDVTCGVSYRQGWNNLGFGGKVFPFLYCLRFYGF